ncbi:MAG: glycoside hydrolase family 66 protein [Bacteroidales bacterium]|nr:glycoside hydrolase family 66 protein [Bacteroidales bacterium]
MRVLKPFILLFLFITLFACKKDDPKEIVPPGTLFNGHNILTNKAAYQPGETVVFKALKNIPEGAKIRYRHLNQVLEENAVSGSEWQWTPPSTDFKGYLAEIFVVENQVDVVLASIAFDVSSEWTKFPRYGFLSKFPEMTSQSVSNILDNLLRHRINGIQFYDWHFDHHKPLAGEVYQPAAVWKDIANRDNYFSTVKAYISGARSRGIKSMSYNLAYGALNSAAADGVSEEWYLFKNSNHTNKDFHPLPAPMFRSNIYLTDPSNVDWQNYLAGRNNDVYQVLDFDGFHIDQLGNRNQNLYNYNGQVVDLPPAFNSFVHAMKNAAPSKYHVMNAVNQYAQQQIATSPVDFLYSEVWNPNNSFQQLAQIISDNDAFSANTKNSVLAAYMNYDLASGQGFFNTPGVLLTNAVILSFGGSHLELGEHMLGKEYFPNNNLQMRGDLRDAMVAYYDFQTAYQNILRDGGEMNHLSVQCTDNKFQVSAWPPQSGKVAAFGRLLNDKQVIHLINFGSATSMLWRDNNGTQPYPQRYNDIALNISSESAVKSIWFASPDHRHGVPVPLEFTQSGETVSVRIPELYFWDMIVLEY